MTITNDQIEFTTADFDGFSDPVKKALTGYLGDYSTYFANSLNAAVDAANQHAKDLAANEPSVASVLEGYAAADATKRAAADLLLADIEVLLNS